MPYKSKAQQGFFHTKTAQKKGITKATVKEFDKASKGKKLPKKIKKSKQTIKNNVRKQTGLQ